MLGNAAAFLGHWHLLPLTLHTSESLTHFSCASGANGWSHLSQGSHRHWVHTAAHCWTRIRHSRRSSTHHAAVHLMSNFPALLVELWVHRLTTFSHRWFLRRLTSFRMESSLYAMSHSTSGMVHRVMTVTFVVLGVNLATFLELQDN